MPSETDSLAQTPGVIIRYGCQSGGQESGQGWNIVPSITVQAKWDGTVRTEDRTLWSVCLQTPFISNAGRKAWAKDMDDWERPLITMYDRLDREGSRVFKVCDTYQTT